MNKYEIDPLIKEKAVNEFILTVINLPKNTGSAILPLSPIKEHELIEYKFCLLQNGGMGKKTTTINDKIRF